MNNPFQQNYKGNWFTLTFTMVILFFLGEFLAVPFTFIPLVNPVVSALIMPISFLFSSLLLILWVNKKEQKPLYTLGIVPQNILKRLIAGGLYGFTLLTFVIVMLVVIGDILIVPHKLNTTVILTVCVSFVSYSIQATTEELFVRGYLQTRLTAKYGALFAIIFSAIVFMLLHIGNPHISVIGLLNIFFVGVVFACIYRMDKSIWIVSGFHIIWNYAQDAFYGINVSGIKAGPSILTTHYLTEDILTGGKMGIEGSLLLCFCFIFIIIFLIRHFRQNVSR